MEGVISDGHSYSDHIAALASMRVVELPEIAHRGVLGNLESYRRLQFG